MCASASIIFIFMESLLCRKCDAKISSDGGWLLAIDVLWGIDIVGTGNCDGGDTFNQDDGTGSWDGRGNSDLSMPL